MKPPLQPFSAAWEGGSGAAASHRRRRHPHEPSASARGRTPWPWSPHYMQHFARERVAGTAQEMADLVKPSRPETPRNSWNRNPRLKPSGIGSVGEKAGYRKQAPDPRLRLAPVSWRLLLPLRLSPCAVGIASCTAPSYSARAQYRQDVRSAPGGAVFSMRSRIFGRYIVW
jgi:hypothetical protein